MSTPANPAFELHPRLQADTLPLGRVAGSRLLLMNDSRFPWLILVPERAGLTELHQLGEAEQQTLMRTCTALSRRLARGFDAERMNIAALGNVVSQLHVHVVVRRVGDAAWPGPVWGSGPALPYREPQRSRQLQRLTELLDGLRSALGEPVSAPGAPPGRED